MGPQHVFKPMVRISLVIALFFWLTPANAQDSLGALVKKGAEAFRIYDLAAANNYMERALKHKEHLTPAQHGEALYFYSRAQFQLFVEKGNHRRSDLATLELQNRAYKCYRLLLELDRLNVPRWSAKSENQMRAMEESIYEAAMVSLEKYFEQDAKASLYKSLVNGYVSLARTIDPVNSVSDEIKGHLHYFDQDSALAAYHFDECIRLYRTHRLDQAANIRLGDVYGKRARMYLNSDMLDSALSVAERGIEVMKFEISVIRARAGIKYDGGVIKQSNKAYEEILERLDILKAEILSLMPSQYEVAVAYFDSLSTTYSDNMLFQLCWAQTLEAQQPFEALKHILEAVRIEPESFEANHAAGSLYFSLGEDYRKLAAKGGDDQEAYADNAMALFKTGYPFMRAAHQQQPEDRFVLESLYNAARLLNLKGEVNYFASLLN